MALFFIPFKEIFGYLSSSSFFNLEKVFFKLMSRPQRTFGLNVNT